MCVCERERERERERELYHMKYMCNELQTNAEVVFE